MAVDTAQLARLLVGTHLLLAGVTASPELAMDLAEASQLAQPISDLMSLYGWALDPKMEAWAQLIATSVAIYLPRAIAISKRKAQASEAGKTVPEGVLRAAAAAGGIQ